MLKKDIKYQVIEDTNGQLFLFVYDGQDTLQYGKSGYQFHTGSLRTAIQLLEKTGDLSSLEAGDPNPQQLRNTFTEERYHTGEWQTVADYHGIYADKMGISAKIEFDISMDVE